MKSEKPLAHANTRAATRSCRLTLELNGLGANGKSVLRSMLRHGAAVKLIECGLFAEPADLVDQNVGQRTIVLRNRLPQLDRQVRRQGSPGESRTKPETQGPTHPAGT
jgi:hypothetical protein